MLQISTANKVASPTLSRRVFIKRKKPQLNYNNVIPNKNLRKKPFERERVKPENSFYPPFQIPTTMWCRALCTYLCSRTREHSKAVEGMASCGTVYILKNYDGTSSAILVRRKRNKRRNVCVEPDRDRTYRRNPMRSNSLFYYTR